MSWETERIGRLLASEWAWCRACQRGYRVETGRFDHERMVFLCFYEDCDGELLYDGRPWEDVLAFRSEFPAMPEQGTLYPLTIVEKAMSR